VICNLEKLCYFKGTIIFINKHYRKLLNFVAMRLKLKIQHKIQIFIIAASIIIYVIAVGYITLNARKMAFEDATHATNSYTLNAATSIKDKLDSDMSIVISLADAFQIFDEFDKDEWQVLVNKMNMNVYKNTPHIYGLWDSWELSAIDSTYTKKYGRITNILSRVKGSIRSDSDLRSLDGDSELYAEIKSMLIPSITEPYFDVMFFESKQSILMISLSAPIVKNSSFKAAVGIDITLDRIQKIVDKIHPFEGSYAFMISNKGIISGHPSSDLLNVQITDVFPGDVSKFNIAEKIKKGKTFNYITTDENGEEVYFSYAPILVNGTNTPWSVAISVPVKSMMFKASRNFRVSVFVGLLGIVFLVLIIYFIGKNIAKPIIKITQLLKQLSVGNIDKTMKMEMKSGDEFEDMTDSANMLIDGLGRTTEFAKTIGRGNLQAEYQKLGNNDILGNSLLEMRQSLILAEEEEKKRKVEEDKQNWATQGMAKFGEILRQHNQDIKELSFNIMSNLVDYVNAIQGGLFVKNDDDEEIYFELTGAIAYDRKKVIEDKFKVGESLIGRCAYEKLTIYMEEVPEDYVHVTSGLGESNPRSILIVPAILNDEVYAIIELVSFSKFESHQIEFIEKLGESVASTIANARVNERTNKLLEQSKHQSEELAAQEEEMRQNLEELQATQEEVTRLRKEEQEKNQKLLDEVDKNKRALLNILDHIPLKVFLKDKEGKMLIVNQKVLDVHSETRENLIGKNDFDFIDDYNEAKKEWDAEQDIIKSGKPLHVIEVEDINNGNTILDTTKLPFYIDYLDETGILGIQLDITELTEKRKRVKELEKLIAELEKKIGKKK